MSSVQLTGVGSYPNVDGVTALYFRVVTEGDETYEWSDLAIVLEGTTFQQYIENNKNAYLVDIADQISAWTACSGNVTIQDIDGNEVVVNLTKQQYLKPTLPTHKTLLQRVRDIEDTLEL